MAAPDFSDVLPEQGGMATRRATMDSTAGEVVEVILPSWCKSLLITFLTSGGHAAGGWFNFSDAANTAKSDDSFPVASGTTIALGVAPKSSTDTPKIYLACDAASGYAYLTMSVLA